MKLFATISKILVALAAIAGVVYVLATYGDRLVAWAKNLLGSCKCCCGCGCDCECDCDCDCDCDGECGEDCQCPCHCDDEEVEVEVVPAEEAPVAEEQDFA